MVKPLSEHGVEYGTFCMKLVCSMGNLTISTWCTGWEELLPLATSSSSAFASGFAPIYMHLDSPLGSALRA